jgi:hypothetical protein
MPLGMDMEALRPAPTSYDTGELVPTQKDVTNSPGEEPLCPYQEPFAEKQQTGPNNKHITLEESEQQGRRFTSPSCFLSLLFLSLLFLSLLFLSLPLLSLPLLSPRDAPMRTHM